MRSMKSLSLGGARAASIDLAKAHLLGANFAFNDTHRKIIFEVTQAYDQLLDAMGQETAAQAALQDSSTLQQAVEERLAHGLATRPDVLEARAATAQAQYELTSIQGQEQIARGVLASILSVDPTRPLRIQTISTDESTQALVEPLQSFIQRALSLDAVRRGGATQSHAARAGGQADRAGTVGGPGRPGAAGGVDVLCGSADAVPSRTSARAAPPRY